MSIGTLGRVVSQWRCLIKQLLPFCDEVTEEEAPTRNAQKMYTVIRYLKYLHTYKVMHKDIPDQYETWLQRITAIEDYYGLVKNEISIYWAIPLFRSNIFFRFGIDPLHQEAHGNLSHHLRALCISHGSEMWLGTCIVQEKEKNIL